MCTLFTTVNSLRGESWFAAVSQTESSLLVVLEGEESNVMSTPTPPPPLFYSKQLDRSAAIGCTSSTWAALPFLAVPNGAANSMLLAGWQTGRWEPANGRLDKGQPPVNCTMVSPTKSGPRYQLSIDEPLMNSVLILITLTFPFRLKTIFFTCLWPWEGQRDHVQNNNNTSKFEKLRYLLKSNYTSWFLMFSPDEIKSMW